MTTEIQIPIERPTIGKGEETSITGKGKRTETGRKKSSMSLIPEGEYYQKGMNRKFPKKR